MVMPRLLIPDCQRSRPSEAFLPLQATSVCWSKPKPCLNLLQHTVRLSTTCVSAGSHILRPPLRVVKRVEASFFSLSRFASKPLLRRLFCPQRRAKASGDDRDRTGNLRLAKPALSQLSYVPGRVECPGSSVQRHCSRHWTLDTGLESGRAWIRTTDLSFIRAAL